MDENQIQWAFIYTDGSCHTQLMTGAWVAILLVGPVKTVLSGIEKNTNHNRMELTAVIKAIEYVRQQYPNIEHLTVVSDSQYVIGLPGRKQKLEAAGLKTKKGNAIQNSDLIRRLLDFATQIQIKFEKVKAHQKKSEVVNYNIEADILSRKLMRTAVDETESS